MFELVLASACETKLRLRHRLATEIEHKCAAIGGAFLRIDRHLVQGLQQLARG